MDKTERENWYKEAINLYHDGKIDLIVGFKSSLSEEERLAYGSLENNKYLCADLTDMLGLKEEDPVIMEGFTIRLVYLPFSIEPITIQMMVTRKELIDLKEVGIDLHFIIIRKIIDYLQELIKEKEKENQDKKIERETTYRTLNTILYDAL